MKKFFDKKQNILFTILAVIGLIGIVALLVIPHGGKYTRTYKDGEKKYTASYELKDGKIYSSTMLDGEYLTEDVLLGEYVIDGGKISYKVPLTGLAVELGEINAFRYKANLDEDAKYTCSLNVVIFVVACVMTIAGVGGMVFGMLGSNKKTTKKAKSKK